MQIQQNISLKPYNTFGVEVSARRFMTINSTNDLQGFLQLIRKEKQFLILGSGSNLLFTKDFDGLVLLNRMMGKEIISESSDEVILKVSAGENWSDLVDYSVERGWGGVENLSLIPGTIGAAPVQNIGAYGVELKEVLLAVEALEIATAKLHQFTNEACEFSYRSSIFKTKLKGLFVITNVILKLSKQPKLNLTYAPLKSAFSGKKEKEILVQQVSDAVKLIRRSKLPDPKKLGNAGSFFKNPVVPFSKIEDLIQHYPAMPFFKIDNQNYKIAAGWLIEKSGWKGKRLGDVGVHKKQALVLVNYGNATGDEIYRLSQEIKKSVKSGFGLDLETEVSII